MRRCAKLIQSLHILSLQWSNYRLWTTCFMIRGDHWLSLRVPIIGVRIISSSTNAMVKEFSRDLKYSLNNWWCSSFHYSKKRGLIVILKRILKEVSKNVLNFLSSRDLLILKRFTCAVYRHDKCFMVYY